MDKIVLASEEEVERVRAESDLGPGTSVWAMGKDLAVVRQCLELDPVHFAPDTKDSRKLMFVWGMENVLRAQGFPHYYFNIREADTRWQDVVRNFGAQEVSKGLERRFKKVL